MLVVEGFAVSFDEGFYRVRANALTLHSRLRDYTLEGTCSE